MRACIHAAPCDWSQILADAVSKPGVIARAYSLFWNYSVGNQLLALFACHQRGLQPGPINTYAGWQALGRQVKKGQKAITLCMPVTCRRKPEGSGPAEAADGTEQKSECFTLFIYRPRWFVLDQTEGRQYVPAVLPRWKEEVALPQLQVQREVYQSLDGNCQGYACGRTVAVSPLAALPHKTLFHELAHVLLGHTRECEPLVDDQRTPRNLREVEAECVALLCCESLGLEGAPSARGYIQHWLAGQKIPEKSVHKIFKAADQILRAGRSPRPHGA